MESAQPAETVSEAVDHDVSARLHAALSCRSGICRTGIRNVQRPMKTAVKLVRVDDVATFWCAMVSLALLCALGRATKRDRVALERRFTAKERKFTRGLLDDYAIGVSIRWQWMRLVARSAESDNADNPD